MNAKYEKKSWVRPRTKPGYTLANSGVIEENLASPLPCLEPGLKQFGEEGVEAVRDELRQMHDRKFGVPCKNVDLTLEKVKEALGYLMFLKRKRCGRIKAS
jgi:hypothetical protein